MTIDELNDARNLIQEQFNNLSNPHWIAGQLDYLRGKFDHINELINKETLDAASKTKPAKSGADSDLDKRK